MKWKIQNVLPFLEVHYVIDLSTSVWNQIHSNVYTTTKIIHSVSKDWYEAWSFLRDSCDMNLVFMIHESHWRITSEKDVYKRRAHTHFIYQKKVFVLAVNAVRTQLDSECLMNLACFSKELNKRVKMGQQYKQCKWSCKSNGKTILHGLQQ